MNLIMWAADDAGFRASGRFSGFKAAAGQVGGNEERIHESAAVAFLEIVYGSV
jgi:hypothetical protein